MKTLSRRLMLVASPAAALVPIPVLAMPASHPDAVLLALCSEFIACDRDYRAKGEGPRAIVDDDEYEAYGEAANVRMEALSVRLADMPVHTVEGAHGLARCLARHAGDGHCSFDYPDTITGRLLTAVMRGASSVDSGVTA